MMKLYAYILKIDTGFAPNPFHGFCTLACCKPNIRRCSSVGDWVVGLSPKSDGNGLIFAMQIEEKLSFDDYWNDERFQVKKCDVNSPIGKVGDNIYEPLPDGEWKQHLSWHTDPEFTANKCQKHFDRDFCGGYVLVSSKFVYFGREAISLPTEITKIILPLSQGHKCKFSTDEVGKWERYIEGILTKQSCRIALPTIWDESNDQSCTKRKKCRY